MEKEQADAVEQAFNMDCKVAQEFFSHTVPIVVLLFMGEAPDDGMEFEPEDREGYKNEGYGGDDDGGGGMVLPLTALAKTTGE